MEWEFPEDYDGNDPCPMGCGNITDDAYGGPCSHCWNETPGAGDDEFGGGW